MTLSVTSGEAREMYIHNLMNDKDVLKAQRYISGKLDDSDPNVALAKKSISGKTCPFWHWAAPISNFG